MAEGEGFQELRASESQEDHSNSPPHVPNAQAAVPHSKDDPNNGEEETDGDGESEEEEEEPRLKYATLTRNLGALYRNGDATSACLVAGDKMIVGTHNGNIHVLALPSLQSLKVYRAHNASVSALSISPFPPPFFVARADATQRLAPTSAADLDKIPQSSPSSKKSAKQPQIPRTPSNDIYIATSSIDGNVCITSLVDADDVQRRNFGRPVQTVALSPEFKSDRSYISGGQAGNLVLTTGGQKGKSTNATTSGAGGSASSWLGTIGLGGNTGTDKVLHSGEGTISTIKWSLSGKFVLWVNEQGVKIMRSNLHLTSAESGYEWKRISHINRPKRDNWEDMSGVWRARAEWIDRNNLELEENSENLGTIPENGSGSQTPTKQGRASEEVVVGWGDNVWIIRVTPTTDGNDTKDQESKIGKAELVTNIWFNDCTVAGVSLYTPDLLLVLAHLEKKDNDVIPKPGETPKKGRPSRHNGLEPQLRIVDIKTKEELDSDELTVSQFQMLSPSDYHLAILPPVRSPAQMTHKGYLDAIGSGVTAVGSGLYTGVETVGHGVWDATMYGPRMLGANRLFSSGDSVKEPTPSIKGGNYLTGWIPGLGSSVKTTNNDELSAVAASQGMKIFVFSPYDCIVGVKRNLSDRLQWLTKMQRYQQAWELLDEHPEAAGPKSDSSDSSPVPSPSKPSSVAPSSTANGPTAAIAARQHNALAEFFADSASITSNKRNKGKYSIAEKEKRHVGELWLQQLIDADDWAEAGEVTEKVLNTTRSWEQWAWKFIQKKKYDEISFHLPTFQITPPLPSSIFEIVLGYYVTQDRQKFKELLDQWPSDLFEISSITAAIEEQLKLDTAPEGSDDRTMLQESLAKLYLADGHYKDALWCYIHLQDADTALSLIKDHHLVDAIADDIQSFVLLRVSPSQLKYDSNDELEQLSSEPIKLLVDEAVHGIVEIDEVVRQLQSPRLKIFLFFYLRALWRGEGAQERKPVSTIRGRAAVGNLTADEGKIMVEAYADTAVELFAEYDRALLSRFLHSSTSYTFDKAVKICEKRQYIEELVYLLSKTGAMKKALFLIIDELKDVSKAISFAKEQDDKSLWDDFLDYSMSRPKFISGLLAEVGTAIDPITLVKRIPSGLEIEGLKDGLMNMIREYDIQDSISSGVANVLSSEVAVGMDTLRRGRRRGIKFDLASHTKKHKPKPELESTPKPAETPGAEASTSNVITATDELTPPEQQQENIIPPGHCAACRQPFHPDETSTLIAFACGHVYHVPHLLNENEVSLPKKKPRPGDPPEEQISMSKEDDDADERMTSGFTKTVGPKVTNARLLKDKVYDLGGCQVCKGWRERVEEVS